MTNILTKQEFDLLSETEQSVYLTKLLEEVFKDEPGMLELEEELFEQAIKEIPEENRITYEEYRAIVDKKT